MMQEEEEDIRMGRVLMGPKPNVYLHSFQKSLALAVKSLVITTCKPVEVTTKADLIAFLCFSLSQLQNVFFIY